MTSLPQITKAITVAIVGVTFAGLVARQTLFANQSKALPEKSAKPAINWDMQNIACRDGGDNLPTLATPTHIRRFDSIWARRGQQNITTQIRPFLRDEFQPLRVKAVQALSELEDPSSIATLQTLLNRMKIGDNADKPGGIPVVTLQLALARVYSHNLKGESKIATVLNGVDLTWNKFVLYTRKINGKKSSFDSDETIDYMVAVMYTMGKHGESNKVQQMSKELTLTPAQSLKIQAASLSRQQEIQLYLNFLSGPRDVINFDMSPIEAHLAGLGPQAHAAILARLQDMKLNQQKYAGKIPSAETPGAYHQRMNYVGLFEVAGKTKDRRMIPLLRYFEKKGGDQGVGVDWLSRYATMAREKIECKGLD